MARPLARLPWGSEERLETIIPGLSSRRDSHAKPQDSSSPGNPNFKARSSIVNAWMTLQANGRSKLRIVTARCPNLVKQLSQNTRMIDSEGQATEEENKKQRNDLRHCLEYWASRSPTYVEPPADTHIATPAYTHWKKMKERRDAESVGTSRISFGPGVVQ